MNLQQWKDRNWIVRDFLAKLVQMDALEMRKPPEQSVSGSVNQSASQASAQWSMGEVSRSRPQDKNFLQNKGLPSFLWLVLNYPPIAQGIQIPQCMAPL
jgi:hypothetical protein